MIYSIIGLVLDLIGVILLFKFGILPDNLWNHILMDNGMSDKDEKRHKIWSKIAIGLLMIGFGFQLLGSVLQHYSDRKVIVNEFQNLNLGIDYNETTGIKGILKAKFSDNYVSYQLEISGKLQSIDNIQKFTIELEDKDGFKISEIEVSNSAENPELSNLVKSDSIFIKVKGRKSLSGKNYLQIKKWELLALKKK